MTSELPYHFAHYRNDHTAFVSDVLNHRALRDVALAKIGRTSNRDKRRLLIRQFLMNRSFKLLYLFKSVQAKGQLADYPPERMRQVAEELSANSHFFELVQPVNLRSGINDRRRTTYSFGPGNHARQRMVADLLEVLFPLPSGRHFTVRGGVRAALLAVEEHARDGFIYAIERDIEQFYPSVNVIELAKLLKPLPFSVVMNVIAFAPGFRWTGQVSSADAIHDAPLPLRGLLAQGSAASPIAAEVLMADLLRGVPDNVRVMSYADNVLILGETLDSVEAADARLEARVSEHQCGPLRLKPSGNFRNIRTNGLTFLGNDGQWNGHGIEWEPKHAALEAIWRRIDEAQNAEEVINSIRWLRNWRRGYPEWKNGDDEVARYIAQLGSRLAFCAPTKLSRAYNVGMQIVVAYCYNVHAETGQFPDLSELLPDYQDDLAEQGRRPQFIRDVEKRLGTSIELNQ